VAVAELSRLNWLVRLRSYLRMTVATETTTGPARWQTPYGATSRARFDLCPQYAAARGRLSSLRLFQRCYGSGTHKVEPAQLSMLERHTASTIRDKCTLRLGLAAPVPARVWGQCIAESPS
jgi:hypothetical protein